MLARVDIVSVNCPHTPATYHLLSARRLKLLKPEAVVVNTARGEVIDETALARLIEVGDIAGAGLDVRAGAGGEPAPRQAGEGRQGGAAAHMGSATHESRVDMGERSSSTSRPSSTATGRRTASAQHAVRQRTRPAPWPGASGHQPCNVAFRLILAFSTFETGQFFSAMPASSSNLAWSMPGIFAVRVRAEP